MTGANLPPELSGDAILASVPDIPTLAKNYVHAQRMVGTDKIAKPQATWKPEQWSEFYNSIGRPDAADKYKLPLDKVKTMGLEIAPERLAKATQKFHELGLTDAQAAGMFEYYAGTLNETTQAETQFRESKRTAAEAALKQEHGDKYPAVLDLARSVVRKFGDPDGNFVKFLDESGMGDDPNLIRFLHGIAKTISEDTLPQGGSILPLKDSTSAMNEINKLVQDKDFQTALTKANAPGHQEAVARWLKLHEVAHPGKVT
jgi:hypothetical protein